MIPSAFVYDPGKKKGGDSASKSRMGASKMTSSKMTSSKAGGGGKTKNEVNAITGTFTIYGVRM